jgi:hypothetical protein
MKNSKAQIALAIIAGLLCFSLLEGGLSVLAKQAWPAYAAAVPDRNYTVLMLYVRLAFGGFGVAFSGWVSCAIARHSGLAIWLGIAMLVPSIIWHIRIWPHYPVWYHLAWFMIIVPAAVIGGRLFGASHSKTQS